MAKVDRFDKKCRATLKHCLDVISHTPNMGCFRNYIKSKLEMKNNN